jgi:hypothetical protein
MTSDDELQQQTAIQYLQNEMSSLLVALRNTFSSGELNTLPANRPSVTDDDLSSSATDLSVNTTQQQAASGARWPAAGSVISTLFNDSLGLASSGLLSGSSAAESQTGLVSLFFSPLISALARLFSGVDQTTSEPQQLKYEWAPSQQIDEGLRGDAPWATSEVSYSAQGTPRLQSPATSLGSPTVTIQVNAMDSQSFLDHSDHIADAVRKALLNSHPLADAFGEI